MVRIANSVLYIQAGDKEKERKIGERDNLVPRVL